MRKKGLSRNDSPSPEYRLRGRIWVEGKEGTFLGFGRIVLLERIQQYGSITEAAKTMSMSYRHAWELVDSMNRQAKAPLVETASGGKGGGGTRLTEAGVKAIESFRSFNERFDRFLQEETDAFDF
ncbi:MAG: LysR family transcriptional regulator [Thermodesulfovibrionales bacterium]